MFTRKATKALIILITLLIAFPVAEGDELYCVSLKKSFKISSKIHYSIMTMYFEVTNAEIYSIAHKPLAWIIDISKDSNGSGNFSGGVPVFAGGVRLNYFYDDFVVIKKRSGIKFNNIKLKLSFGTCENLKDDTDDKDFEGDKSYEFTNKDLNIRRCSGKVI